MKDLPVTDVEKAFEKKNQHSLMAKQPSLQEWKGMEWNGWTGLDRTGLRWSGRNATEGMEWME